MTTHTVNGIDIQKMTTQELIAHRDATLTADGIESPFVKIANRELARRDSIILGAMTPDEFLAAMKEIPTKVDYDLDYHFHGDELMCKQLRALGYGAAIDIWESWNRYYS